MDDNELLHRLRQLREQAVDFSEKHPDRGNIHPNHVLLAREFK